MAITNTVYLNDFRDAFLNAGRGSSFTYEGLGVLFDYLEDLSESLGEPIELDVIAFCSEYSEGTPEEIAEQYGVELPEREEWMDDDDYNEEVKEVVRDYLYDHTPVCGVTDSGTIVYAIF